MNLIILALFIAYAAFEGWREGIYWHIKIGSRYYDWKPKVEEHVIFTIQRAIVIIMGCSLLFFTGMAWYWCVASLIGLALCFSFMHNGAMYLTRNELDNTLYPKRWMAQSTSSVAKTTKFMTPVSRTIQFILGVLINVGAFIGHILL